MIADFLHRHLHGLDDDLFRELDAVCSENQLTCYPVSRGRNSDDYFLEKYPELAPLLESDRQERIESMKLRLRLNRVELNEGKSRPAVNEKAPVSPSLKPKAGLTNELPSSPVLNAKHSTGDLMFQMDDDDVSLPPATPMKGKAAAPAIKENDIGTDHPDPDFPALGASLPTRDRNLSPQIATPYKQNVPFSPPTPDVYPSAAWGSPAPPSAKKDLKEIMAEASQTRQPNHLSISNTRESSGNFKISQKERKKLQQQQAQEKLAAEQRLKEARQNPWQTPATPMKGDEEPKPGYLDQKPTMTLRQTVAGTPPSKSKPEPTPSKQQSHPPPAPKQTPTKQLPPASSAAAPSTSPNTAATPQPSIQSIRHIPRPEPYPSFQSPSSQSHSLASIFMQQQTEKNEIREAATAKHNLQDIQLEQEFNEWWDKESKRVQGLAEAESTTSASGRSERGGRGGGGRGKGSRPQQKRHNKKGPGNASDVSALTQQLSGHASLSQKSVNGQRDAHPKAPVGNHADSPSHTRRGGRNHHRGKGRDRDRGIQSH